MSFPTAKLLDHEHRLAELKREANPFALVTAAHLTALRTRRDVGRRFAAKRELVRLLYAQGWERQRVIDLFAIIDWMLQLPKPLEQQVWQDIETIEGKADMKYVTSSHCTVGSSVLNGIPPRRIRKVIGTMKAYETYVGNRTDYTNEADPIFQEIQRVGAEFGATTGRPRKVNWMNLDRVIMAANINGVTQVIINKADVLKQVGHFGIILDGKLEKFSSFDNFRNFVNGILTETCTSGFTIVWSETPNGI